MTSHDHVIDVKDPWKY